MNISDLSVDDYVIYVSDKPNPFRGGIFRIYKIEDGTPLCELCFRDDGLTHHYKLPIDKDPDNWFIVTDLAYEINAAIPPAHVVDMVDTRATSYISMACRSGSIKPMTVQEARGKVCFSIFDGMEESTQCAEFIVEANDQFYAYLAPYCVSENIKNRKFGIRRYDGAKFYDAFEVINAANAMYQADKNQFMSMLGGADEGSNGDSDLADVSELTGRINEINLD